MTTSPRPLREVVVVPLDKQSRRTGDVAAATEAVAYLALGSEPITLAVVRGALTERVASFGRTPGGTTVFRARPARWLVTKVRARLLARRAGKERKPQ